MDCHFRGGGGCPDLWSSINDKLVANPENDSPYEITHKIKSSPPHLMILVLLYWGKDALATQAEKGITVDLGKLG